VRETKCEEMSLKAEENMRLRLFYSVCVPLYKCTLMSIRERSVSNRVQYEKQRE
jgi:hypothetical protein